MRLGGYLILVSDTMTPQVSNTSRNYRPYEVSIADVMYRWYKRSVISLEHSEHLWHRIIFSLLHYYHIMEAHCDNCTFQRRHSGTWRPRHAIIWSQVSSTSAGTFYPTIYIFLSVASMMLLLEKQSRCQSSEAKLTQKCFCQCFSNSRSKIVNSGSVCRSSPLSQACLPFEREFVIFHWENVMYRWTSVSNDNGLEICLSTCLSTVFLFDNL